MRSFIVMAMFIASIANADWKDYSETKELSIDAGGIEQLRIEAGAGSLDVKGVAGLDDIAVTATIVVKGADEEEARSLIDKRMTLTLDAEGDRAQLMSIMKDGFLGIGPNARIDLEVRVPAGTAIDIRDSSGSIDLYDVEADVKIDDGSGSIDVHNVAGVTIDDGSGSIDVSDAAGDVSIVDGSGSISVQSVQGSVTIDDGSGGIKVSDVEKDLVIVDDGSGGVKYSDVRGVVDQQS